MMRKFRKAALLALALMLMVAATAEFSMDRTGNLSVRIHTAEGEDVAGAHVALYRVGDPKIVDGNLTFRLADGFAGSGVSLEALDADGLAGTLWRWARNHGVKPCDQADTSVDGTTAFDGLETGLYVVAQEGFAGGKTMYFTEIEPFLVMMPMTNDAGDGWTYAIAAQPKVNPLPKPTPAPTDPPRDETLPQTGMVRWPILVLGVGGVLLFSLGWALCFVRRKKGPEDHA